MGEIERPRQHLDGRQVNCYTFGTAGSSHVVSLNAARSFPMIRRTPARDERGQILILTALSMTVLLGMAAFSVDASFMYDKRNKLYAAADAAAKLGATEVHRNSSVTQAALEAFAAEQVRRHGLTPGSWGTTTPGIAGVQVNRPPLNGPFAGQAGYVEVLIAEVTNTFFGKVLGVLSLTPGARAVAGMGPGANCIVTLGSPGATPTSLSVSNSAINMACNVADGGDLDINASGLITGGSTDATGTCGGNGGGGGCANVSNLTQNAPAPNDPLAGVFPPLANPGGCQSLVLTTPTPTINPGCYSRIRMDATGMTLTLNPGNYYITGPFTAANQPTINGNGVFLYFAGTAPTGPCVDSPPSPAGCIDMGNRATATLSAPTSGTYNAMLMWQESTDQLNASFMGNNPLYNFSGAMYFPNADVSFRNGLSGSNDCTLFVARSLSIDNGNGSFGNTCSAYGGSPILSVSVAE
jgi:Flp pilus assembly protein TadG